MDTAVGWNEYADMAGCEFGSQWAIFRKFSGSNARPLFRAPNCSSSRLAEGQSCFESSNVHVQLRASAGNTIHIVIHS